MTYFFVTMYLVGKVYRELRNISFITIVNLQHQHLHQFVWEGAVVALLPLTFPFYHVYMLQVAEYKKVIVTVIKVLVALSKLQ